MPWKGSRSALDEVSRDPLAQGQGSEWFQAADWRRLGHRHQDRTLVAHEVSMG